MNRKSWPFDWLLSVSLRLVCCGIVSKIIVKTFASPKGYLSFSLFPLNHHNYFEKHSKQNEKKKTKQKKQIFTWSASMGRTSLSQQSNELKHKKESIILSVFENNIGLSRDNETTPTPKINSKKTKKHYEERLTMGRLEWKSFLDPSTLFSLNMKPVQRRN